MAAPSSSSGLAAVGTLPLPPAAAGLGLSGTTDLSGRHSQLLALTHTIELLLGKLESSGDVDADVQELQLKFQQFDQLVQQASVEAIPLGQLDRQTWSKLLISMRSLSSELRDEFEWKKENLKDKIDQQRRAKQPQPQPPPPPPLPLRRAHVKEGLAGAAVGGIGAGKGNPFADEAAVGEPGLAVHQQPAHYPPAPPSQPLSSTLTRAPHPPKPLQVGASTPLLDNAAVAHHRAALSPLAPARGVPPAIIAGQGAREGARQAVAGRAEGGRAADEEKAATLGPLTAADTGAGASMATYTALRATDGCKEGQTHGGSTVTAGTTDDEDKGDDCCLCCAWPEDGLKGVTRRTWIWLALAALALVALGLVAWGAVEAARPDSGTTTAVAIPPPSSGGGGPAVNNQTDSSSSTGAWSREGDPASSSSSGADVGPGVPIPGDGSSSGGSSSDSGPTASSTGPDATPLQCEVSQLRLAELRTSRAHVWHDAEEMPGAPLELDPGQIATLQVQVLYPVGSRSAQREALQATLYVNAAPPLAVELRPLPETQRRMAVFVAASPLTELRSGAGESNTLGVEVAHCDTRFATSFSFTQPSGGADGRASSSTGGAAVVSSTAAAPPVPAPSSTGREPPAIPSSTAAAGPVPEPPSSTGAAEDPANPIAASSTAANLDPDPSIQPSSTGNAAEPVPPP